MMILPICHELSYRSQVEIWKDPEKFTGHLSCHYIKYFESTEWSCLIFGRIPVWPYAKLILTCWLVIPYFKGAAYVYDHFLRPIVINPQNINIWYVPRKTDIFNEPTDILTAAEKYIQEHGTQEFENLIHRVRQCQHWIFYHALNHFGSTLREPSSKLCNSDLLLSFLQTDKSRSSGSSSSIYDEDYHYWLLEEISRLVECNLCFLYISGVTRAQFRSLFCVLGCGFVSYPVLQRLVHAAGIFALVQ